MTQVNNRFLSPGIKDWATDAQYFQKNGLEKPKSGNPFEVKQTIQSRETARQTGVRQAGTLQLAELDNKLNTETMKALGITGTGDRNGDRAAIKLALTSRPPVPPPPPPPFPPFLHA